MATILKIADGNNSLEVGVDENCISFWTCNEEIGNDSIWTQISLDQQEVKELIKFLQKRLKEME